MTAAQTIALLCALWGGECLFIEEARVTEYAPELGGINCMEPCHLTAYLEPIDYGVTVACVPGIPYGTQVYIDGVGWRTCLDHGGAIDDDEIDVAVRPAELWHGVSGYRDVVLILE